MALDTNDIHVQRGLFFPWKVGISERLVIPDLEEFTAKQKGNLIPIMKNLTLDYNKVTSMAIAGNSGAGKSYALTYFLSMLKNFSDLIIVDPKLRLAVGLVIMELPFYTLRKIALNQTLFQKSMNTLVLA